jgi:hypothetical protein
MKLPIPSDWDNETWCRYAICWPASEQWLAILRGFITLPQRGWTWDERTGSIVGVQEIGRQITAQSLPEREVLMACGDEGLNAIALAIEALATATATANSGGCCEDRTIDTSGGYQGTVPSDGGDVPIYGSVPPKGLDPGETYPPEFETQEAFDQHKCSIAYAIFDGVLLTLSFLSGISIANISALAGIIGAGIAGILIFPPSALVIMVGAVLAIGGFLAMFLDIRNLMLERKMDFICAMYDTTSVSEAISTIADLLDVIIALIPASGLVGNALKVAMLALFNSDTLNQLYETSVDILYPDADCSSCCPECAEENIYEVDFSSGWSVDNSYSGMCVILANQGTPNLTQGATLDFGVSNPGAFKFVNVAKEVDFVLVQNIMRFEFTVTSVDEVSCYWHLIFDDETCEGHGPGTADPGAHVIEENILPENACKRVIALVFSTGSQQGLGDATVSITSASLLCEALG